MQVWVRSDECEGCSGGGEGVWRSEQHKVMCKL